MREFVCKRFEELTREELYLILKHRSSVFIVEQNCVYQDLDDMDQNAIHIWMNVDGKMVAYARVLGKNTYLDEIAIGRVLSIERNKGYGMDIFRKAISVAEERLDAEKIKIRAQQQAEKFYNKFGFFRCNSPFMYEGLPHVDMLWEKAQPFNHTEHGFKKDSQSLD